MLALPAIAVGMAMRVAFGNRREGAFGEALAGFGVFFLGIDILKEAFAGVELSLGAQGSVSGLQLLSFVGIGFLLTLVMQSSSAALVITLSAAASGVLPLTAAAAMVVGANVGTTTTAVFAVIGATAAAKRAAAAHVIFNLVVAVVALVALPLFLGAIAAAGTVVLGHPLAAATALAAFHTLTKLSGILLLWPFTGTLTRWLEDRFHKEEPDAFQPRFLDRNIAGTPSLALDAVAQELGRTLEMTRQAATRAITVPIQGRAQVRSECVGLNRLLDGIGEFAVEINDPARSEDIAIALRVKQYLADVGERVIEYMQFGEEIGEVGTAEAESLREINTRAHAVLAGAGDTGSIRREFEARYQTVKADLLRAGADRRMPVRQMVAALDQISALRRLVDQFAKASATFVELQSSLASKDSTA
jgi:phosphate:Na+ symporter